MSKIKILYLGMSLNKGGIEKMLISTFQNIDQSKFQIDFLTGHKNIAYENEIKELNGRVHKIKLLKGFKGKIYNVYSFYIFFRNHPEYKIVHNHLMSYYDISPIIAQKLAKVPNIIIHARGSKLTNNLTRSKILHLINKPIALFSANNYIAVSKNAAEFMYPKKSLSNVKIVKNGIDLKKFKFSNNDRIHKREMMSLEGKVIYGHVGAFLPVKNHKFIIEVFYEIQKKQSNAHLVLVGEGILKNEMIDYSKKIGIKEKITFYGSTDNVQELLSTFDILIFPSISEGFGNVIIEAQSVGLPCFINETLPLEVDITDLINRLPLSLSASEWADKILNYNNINDRKDYSEKINKNGYNLINMIKTLETYYIELGIENNDNE